MIRTILSATLITATAISLVACAKSELEFAPDVQTVQTTKFEDTDSDSLDDPQDGVIEKTLSSLRIFISVEDSFASSEIIVRGTCKSIEEGNIRNYLFDVNEVYCGDFKETTLYVREKNGMHLDPLYEVGKEYYLPLNQWKTTQYVPLDENLIKKENDMLESGYENYFQIYDALSLPVYEPQRQFVFTDTPISEHAREETVLALSSPDTAAEYFRTRRFSEINAELIAEEYQPKSDNAD